MRRSLDSLRSLGMTKNSEIANLCRLQLKLQFVSDQGDELTICGLALGIADEAALSLMKDLL